MRAAYGVDDGINNPALTELSDGCVHGAKQAIDKGCKHEDACTPSGRGSCASYCRVRGHQQSRVSVPCESYARAQPQLNSNPKSLYDVCRSGCGEVRVGLLAGKASLDVVPRPGRRPGM